VIKKTIKYTDFDGNPREEDFYFNFSKAEVMEMEMGVSGGMSAMLKRLVANQDNEKIMNTFKTFILKSYGEKSPDGKRFIKNPELSKAFEETEAYSELFMELMSDETAASVFIAGILPAVPTSEKIAKPSFNVSGATH